MNTSDITAALDAANIRHTPEALAMLAECNAEPDWEAYRDALGAFYAGKAKASTPLDDTDIKNAKGLKETHPHMPETKALKDEIYDLTIWLEQKEARIAELEEEVAAVYKLHRPQGAEL